MTSRREIPSISGIRTSRITASGSLTSSRVRDRLAPTTATTRSSRAASSASRSARPPSRSHSSASARAA